MMKFALTLALVCAVSATWTKVGDVSDIITALQFTSEDTGFAASSSQNDPGVAVLDTTDGAKTWTLHAVGKGLLPLGVAAAPPNVLVAGLFTDYISHDNGTTWSTTTGDHVQSQCQRAANGQFYSVGGQDFGKGQGVCVSDDGGKSFKGYYAPCAISSARYGAFPSKDVYYLTLGSWPETDDDNAPTGQVAAMARRLNARLSANATGWAAQIVATTDGGATWTSQYTDTGNFYFNEIACQDTTHCCAAGEADNTSPNPGVRIYCTEDGKTWTKNYFDAQGAGLMTMASLGNGMYKAGGTCANGNTAAPCFYTSTDNGKTWTQEEVTGVGEAAIIASSFPNAKVGYAAGIDNTNSMVIIKWTP